MFSARLGFFQGTTAVAGPQDVIFTTATSPFIWAYVWTDATGYGTKYANPSAAVGATRGIAMKTDNSVVFASTTGNSPYMNAWAYTVGTGFGSKYSNPAAGLTTPEEVAWNNTTSSVITCAAAIPYVAAWAWSSGFGSRYSNPATAVGGVCDAVQFNYAGNVVATGPDASPFIVAYAWSSSGFGTKFSNPASLPSSEPFGISFGLSDNFMVITDASGRIISYNWNNTTGFGTQISNISIAVGAASQGSTLNGAGDYLFIADDGNNNGRSFSISSTGTVGATATSSVNTGLTLRAAVANKKTDASVVFAAQSTPYQAAYPVSAGVFGTKYANPATAINGTGRDAVFTN